MRKLEYGAAAVITALLIATIVAVQAPKQATATHQANDTQALDVHKLMRSVDVPSLPMQEPVAP